MLHKELDFEEPTLPERRERERGAADEKMMKTVVIIVIH
jgi:hypothetical protein